MTMSSCQLVIRHRIETPVRSCKHPKDDETQRKTAKDDERLRKTMKHDEIQHKLTKTTTAY